MPLNPFSRDGYFGRLSEAFGWRYVLVVMITYGLNQGGLSYWGRQGRAFYFRDAPPKGIQLSPAKSLVVENFGKLPWDLKAIFGLVSDAFAIRGYHRTPYVLMAAIFGFIGWGFLGVLEQPGAGLVTILVVLGNVSIAMPDVMIDATVAAKCRAEPDHAVDLQSLGWSSIYFTSILFPLAFGPMYNAFDGAKTIFLVCLVFPPMLFFPTLFGWLSEEKNPDPRKPREEFFDIMKNAITCGRYQGKFSDEDYESNHENESGYVAENPKAAIKDEDNEHTYSKREEYLRFGKLYLLAIVISVVVFTLGIVLSEYGSEKEITLPIWALGTTGICLALYLLMGPITKDLAFGAMYIFLRNALAPAGGSVLTFWNTDTVNNPNNYNQCGDQPVNWTRDTNGSSWGLNRPCLSEQYVTSVDSLGGVMGLFGIMAYNKFLSHWKYKQIFFLTATMSLLFSFLDFIWVNRWNVEIGLPDEFMRLFGEEIVIEIIGNWDTVPMFVMAAKLCPKGLEATLFALLMGLSNFGRTMAAYMGAIIINELEISQTQSFDNLSTWILIRNLCLVLVVCLVPILVPEGSPQDRSIYEDESEGFPEEFGDGEEKKRGSRASLYEALATNEAARRTSLVGNEF